MLKRSIRWAVGTVLAFVTTFSTAAFPDKPIRLVVPFAAGGATDVVARQLGLRLGQELRQPVIVENRPGAGGNIGAGVVVGAPADGYTLLVASPAEVAINQFLYAHMPYDPVKDLTAVARVATVPLVLVVNAASPVTSVSALVKSLKERARANYASSGTGGPQHLAGEWFRLLTGTTMTHVPYKGGAPAMADLLGGQVDLFFAGLPSALTHIRAGKLRALAVTTSQRSPLIPEVSTLAEQGFPDFSIENWQGVFAPAGTPEDVRTVLAQTIQKIAQEKTFADHLQAQGASPAYMNPGAFSAFVTSERAKYSQLIKASGAKAD